MSPRRRDDFGASDSMANRVSRQEYFLAQSRMEEALKWPYRGVNGPTGRINWHWLADDGLSYNVVNGYARLSSTNIATGDFFMLPTGGPYVDVDTNETLYYVNAGGWQHFGTLPALVWLWSRPDLANVSETVWSKWQSVGANQRSWEFQYDVTNVLRFRISSLGTAASIVNLDSTMTRTAGTWYFWAGYFNPATLMKNYHAAATDNSLSSTRLAVGVPAVAFNSNADFMLGAEGITGVNVQLYFNGGIGIGGYWQGVPTTETLIDAWANWIFQWTKPHYGG